MWPYEDPINSSCFPVICETFGYQKALQWNIFHQFTLYEFQRCIAQQSFDQSDIYGISDVSVSIITASNVGQKWQDWLEKQKPFLLFTTQKYPSHTQFGYPTYVPWCNIHLISFFSSGMNKKHKWKLQRVQSPKQSPILTWLHVQDHEQIFWAIVVG